MKQTLQSRFLHCVAPYLSNGILSPSDYSTTIKSLHTKAVSFSNLLTLNLQTASPQIAAEEANLSKPYWTTFFQLRSSFCISLHFYRERIGLILNPLCPSCGVKPHTAVHVFSCSSHPTPMTEMELWERPRLTSEFLFGLLLIVILPPPPPPPTKPPPSGGQES